jgi:hypothetical protein
MKNIYEVLRQKELDRSRLKTEVEALRVVAPLLAEDEEAGNADEDDKPTLDLRRRSPSEQRRLRYMPLRNPPAPWDGKTESNGAASHETTTLFAGDSIQTDEDSVANITAAGSELLVMPDASIKWAKW